MLVFVLVFIRSLVCWSSWYSGFRSQLVVVLVGFSFWSSVFISWVRRIISGVVIGFVL